MSSADRSGCGCLLIALSSPVALVGYLLSGMVDTFGTDHWWQELIVYAVLVTGIGGVAYGIYLISRRPSGTRAGTTSGARARRPAHLERVDRELRIDDRVFHDYDGYGVVTQVMLEDGWVTIRFEDEAADARLAPKFTSPWWADR